MKIGAVFMRDIRVALSEDLTILEYWSPPDSPKESAEQYKFLRLDTVYAVTASAPRELLIRGERDMVLQCTSASVRNNWIGALREAMDLLALFFPEAAGLTSAPQQPTPSVHRKRNGGSRGPLRDLNASNTAQQRRDAMRQKYGH